MECKEKVKQVRREAESPHGKVGNAWRRVGISEWLSGRTVVAKSQSLERSRPLGHSDPLTGARPVSELSRHISSLIHHIHIVYHSPGKRGPQLVFKIVLYDNFGDQSIKASYTTMLVSYMCLKHHGLDDALTKLSVKVDPTYTVSMEIGIIMEWKPYVSFFFACTSAIASTKCSWVTFECPLRRAIMPGNLLLAGSHSVTKRCEITYRLRHRLP